jgi:hypothetical protein
MNDLIKKVIQETFSFGYGNNDYLSDLGNPDIKDKMGATAFQPDPVGVRMGLVNEFDEDLEYNYVDDATKDKYTLTEKQKQKLKDCLIEIEETLKHLDEDFGGSELYSTNDLVGDISKPPYRKGTTEVEENELIEREKKYMDGSVAVDVKKQCRLAGLGNTSKACNQGDIENLTFKKIKEETSNADVKMKEIDEKYNYQQIKAELMKQGKLPPFQRGKKVEKPPLKFISHTVVELNESSRERLLRQFRNKNLMPDGWEELAYYMKINLGAVNKDTEPYVPFPIILYATEYAINDKVLCVRVNSGKIKTDNALPYITVAVDEKVGATSEECNNIPKSGFIELKRPIRLIGKIKEIPYKIGNEKD